MIMAENKMPSAGVTAETPDRVMLGAGVYAQGLSIDKLPTAEEVTAGIIGATNGGGKIEIVPEFLDLEIDGVLVKTKGMTQKVGDTDAITQGDNLETLPYAIWIYDEKVAAMKKTSIKEAAEREEK